MQAGLRETDLVVTSYHPALVDFTSGPSEGHIMPDITAQPSILEGIRRLT